MEPKLGYNTLLITVVFLLSACNTETAIKDEEPDPVLVEYPVVYIERTLDTQTDENNITPARFDALNPARFNPGAKLLIKKNAFADSPVTDLTSLLFGEDPLIDIRDLSVSDDGQEMLISVRAPEIQNADDEDQPRWNIWRYQLSTQILERIISSDNLAEQGDDLMPSFLPDGRIIFASTRQRLSRAILLDEGKPQYTALDERRDNATFNIHVMNADGTSIEQLTFNLSHDFYPLVLQNGQILYSRWDAMGGDHGINLYRMNPDGTDNTLVFGWHSHQLMFDEKNEQIEFIKPQQMPSGEILMLLGSNDGTVYQKRPVLINITDYIDNEQATAESGAQANAVTDLMLSERFNFNFSSDLSESGRLHHLYPLPDSSHRYLMSWDVCRVIVDNLIKACGQLSAEALADEAVVLAEPLFELWLLDTTDNTQQLVASTQAGKIITEAAIMRPSEQVKTFIADKVIGTELDAQLSGELAAAIHIRSVYDFDGIDITVQNNNPEGIARLRDPSLTPASNLPARFLRLIRGVPMPPDEVKDIANTDFGRSNNQLMREIIGYTPIQPDGSVKVKVPANTPFAISILDEKGQRINGRHRQWITLKPGEVLECNGCHTANSEEPHGRIDAQAASINVGAMGGTAYPNATQNIIPTQGQTMAQADEMVNGLAELTSALNYQDRWTDPEISLVNPSITYAYENLSTVMPNGVTCFNNWTAYCRIQINYAEHIQPLWDLPRELRDEDTEEFIANQTCTSCHNVTDSDGFSQVPAGQLDLSAKASSDQPAHLTGYRELFFSDVEQEVIDGILIDRLIAVLDDNGNIVFEIDSEGELILDGEGNPIPVLTTVGIQRILSTNGAASSARFFEVINNVTHQNMMTGDETKLLREWLDIGGQYYNTPFYSQD
jgi:hypothetical protein